MIINQSCIECGPSTTRLSGYLSLCRIKCLVRNVTDVTPQRRVDQPGKAGQALTIAQKVIPVEPVSTVTIDYDRKIGNRTLTLKFKSEMARQLRTPLGSLTEAGTVILQQGNGDQICLPLYSASIIAESSHPVRGGIMSTSTLTQEHEERKICLAFNKQRPWVDGVLSLLGGARQNIDYLMVVNNGQIRGFIVPKSRR
jgi:hypothetical protein